jgi:cysteine synthase A
VNVAAAIRVARELGPGHVVVTILCDSGAKYLSRLFNREWLAQKNLLASAEAGYGGPLAEVQAG